MGSKVMDGKLAEKESIIRNLRRQVMTIGSVRVLEDGEVPLLDWPGISIGQTQ